MLPINLLLQNRYRLIRLIGQGGMGAVYEAVDQRLAHTVALKQILRGDAHAFEREARLLARLSHPALPKVSDHFAEEAGQFLVMEFIPGDDLAKSLLRQEAPFSVEKVLTWGDQLLDVLVYLHSQTPPVLHRDIKPANVKLTNQGQIVLLDFGLAKGKTGETSAAQKSAPGYTLCYAAPEQIRGEGTDIRSDLYSVAATLYHLLTGIKPPDAIQRALAMADGKPEPLWSTQFSSSSVSSILLTVLRKAMALNPAERFATASALRSALQAASQTQATEVIEIERIEQPMRHLAPVSLPHNLPTQLTTLIGREQEIITLQTWLAHDDSRLITLTGAGGSGKTRLALAIAQTIVDRSANPLSSTLVGILQSLKCTDGVFFVNLAPIRDAELVTSTIAQTLGVKETVEAPLSATLQAYLRDKNMLLVLDNFEQIIPAAPLVTELLAACPLLKIIVTSREVLRVRGEREFLVPVLAVPSPTQVLAAEALAHYAAIELFVQRAQAAKPSFVLDETNSQAVAEICVRLDGLPLAIELAAARCKLLTPQAVLARLSDRFRFLSGGARDLPERQRTLQSTIDWSYELLSKDEKTLFRRLAIFVGGRTLEAIEAVCNPLDDEHVQPLQGDVLDSLASLLDKSLVYSTTGHEGEARFAMLMTIHEYAMARLIEHQEFEVMRRRHAQYYYTYIEKAEPHFFGSDLELWLDRLQAELDNIRSILEWGKHTEEGVETALKIAGLLWRFWEVRGHVTEGREWLHVLLAKASNLPASARYYALHTIGLLALNQGDYESAKLFFEECLALSQELGYKRIVGHMYINLGNVAYKIGDYSQAPLSYEKALKVYEERGEKWNIATALGNLGCVALDIGNYEQAQLYLEQSLQLYREVGDNQRIATELCNLGRIAQAQNDPQKAERLYREALALFQTVSDMDNIAWALDNLGEIARYEGNYAQAQALHNESLNLNQKVDDKPGIASNYYNLGIIAYYQGAYTVARTYHHTSLTLRQKLGDQLGMVNSLEALAPLVIAQGTIIGGIQLLGAAATMRQLLGTPLPPCDQPNYNKLLEFAREKLSLEVFTQAWTMGQTMHLDQAIEYALQLTSQEK